MAITSWSHSKVVDFEKCKFLCWLKHDQKIPEPDRPLPPGKTEHANDRGTRIHNSAEAYVNGTGEFIREMSKFEDEFKKLRHLYDRGMVSLEGEWGMDQNWEIAPWKGAWLRAKVDALVMLSPISAVVIDYKSGRRFGNEIKHAEQVQLYQLNTFLRHPELEEVTTELWYLDTDEIATHTFTRDQGLRFKRNWDQRGHRITSCDTWPANPNKFSCKWCGYGPWGTGHCEKGVR